MRHAILTAAPQTHRAVERRSSDESPRRRGRDAEPAVRASNGARPSTVTRPVRVADEADRAAPAEPVHGLAGGRKPGPIALSDLAQQLAGSSAPETLGRQAAVVPVDRRRVPPKRRALATMLRQRCSASSRREVHAAAEEQRRVHDGQRQFQQLLGSPAAERPATFRPGSRRRRCSPRWSRSRSRRPPAAAASPARNTASASGRRPSAWPVTRRQLPSSRRGRRPASRHASMPCTAISLPRVDRACRRRRESR